MKGFATSLAIVLSFVAGVILFEFQVTTSFLVGTAMVVTATYLYNLPDSESRLFSALVGFSLIFIRKKPQLVEVQHSLPRILRPLHLSLTLAISVSPRAWVATHYLYHPNPRPIKPTLLNPPPSRSIPRTRTPLPPPTPPTVAQTHNIFPPVLKRPTSTSLCKISLLSNTILTLTRISSTTVIRFLPRIQSRIRLVIPPLHRFRDRQPRSRRFRREFIRWRMVPRGD